MRLILLLPSTETPNQICLVRVHLHDILCEIDDDFGAFEYEGVPVYFKIDYFDKDSPDPADPAVTERVITLMLATEY